MNVRVQKTDRTEDVKLFSGPHLLHNPLQSGLALLDIHLGPAYWISPVKIVIAVRPIIELIVA